MKKKPNVISSKLRFSAAGHAGKHGFKPTHMGVWSLRKLVDIGFENFWAKRPSAARPGGVRCA